MRPAIILSLSSVLFKSYFRAGRRSRLSFFSQPKNLLVVDIIAMAIPLVLLQIVLPYLPEEMVVSMEPMVGQALVGLPMFLTSAIILAGILFELGQGSGLSSSEAVNWLPISPKEYVAASAISVIGAYSLFFAISVGVTLPLSLKFGLMHVWPIAVILSALALLLGGFIIEVIKAAMNRVSSTVYRTSGRFGVVSRLLLMIIFFVMIQLAFNPYILYSTLGIMASGVDLFWVIPMIWPSVAVANLIRLEGLLAVTFFALSIAFVFLIFMVASNLRLKYWSPLPVLIVIKSSAEYVPHTPSLSRFGFSPLAAEIALKEFRALVRRKDLSRYLAVPIVIAIVFLLPTLYMPADYSGFSSGFFLPAMMPFVITMMFSTSSVGQEGKAVINLLMLPILTKEFIQGKLLPTWIISTIATVGAVVGLQILAPRSILPTMVMILDGVIVIMVVGFIGLGAGSRYPDFTGGRGNRYLTFEGSLVILVRGGVSTLAIFAPIFLYQMSSSVPIPTLGLTATLLATITIGSTLTYFAYRYCKSGVENFLTNLEA